jgi:hypothetical protein
VLVLCFAQAGQTPQFIAGSQVRVAARRNNLDGNPGLVQRVLAGWGEVWRLVGGVSVVGGWLLVVGAAAQSSEAGLVEGDAKPQASKIWAHSYSGMHDRLESSMAMRIAGLYCTLSTCEGQGVAG